MRSYKDLIVALILCSAACSTPAGSSPTSAADTGKGDISADTAMGSDCKVTFRWLQKDAYASRAGRTTELWPPHTTTVLDVECRGQAPVSAFRENHGTKPSDKDETGKQILVEVAHKGPFYGSKARTQALLTAYKGCECAPTTTFLAMDSLQEQKAIDMMTSLAAYVEANMSCEGMDIAQLGQWMKEGSIDQVLGALSTCSWKTGEDWATGFQSATREVLGAEFANYHLCNNDAQLEAALIDSYAEGKDIMACDGNSAACHGPAFFYNP